MSNFDQQPENFQKEPLALAMSNIDHRRLFTPYIIRSGELSRLMG
jgi:hypothetical protein